MAVSIRNHLATPANGYKYPRCVSFKKDVSAVRFGQIILATGQLRKKRENNKNKSENYIGVFIHSSGVSVEEKKRKEERKEREEKIEQKKKINTRKEPREEKNKRNLRKAST